MINVLISGAAQRKIVSYTQVLCLKKYCSSFEPGTGESQITRPEPFCSLNRLINGYLCLLFLIGVYVCCHGCLCLLSHGYYRVERYDNPGRYFLERLGITTPLLCNDCCECIPTKIAGQKIFATSPFIQKIGIAMAVTAILILN